MRMNNKRIEKRSPEGDGEKSRRKEEKMKDG